MAKVVINSEKCKGCGLCVEACPRNVLAISRDSINSKGHYPAEVTDMTRCTGCASCAIMCPDCVIYVER